MSDAIVKFDPKSYVDKIREKIKSALVDVVPDEQWDTMVRAEIDHFFKPRAEQVDEWNHRKTVIHPSDFQTVARRVLAEIAEKEVRESLANSEEWRGVWDNGRQVAGKRVKELLVEHAGAVIEQWLQTAFQQAASAVFHQQIPR